MPIKAFRLHRQVCRRRNSHQGDLRAFSKHMTVIAVGAAGAWILRRPTTGMSDLIDQLAGFALAVIAVGLFYLAVVDAGLWLRRVRQISALSGCFRHKWRGYVLNLLAPALRTSRMSGFMFSKMFGMFEDLTTLLAPVLVSRHGIPPTRILRVVLTR